MADAATLGPRIVRLDTDQVHAMIAAGTLREGAPIELLDGVLVYKDRSACGEDPVTIGKRHNLVVKLLAALDRELNALGRHMQTQGPLALSAHDEPEPDGVILRGGPRDYLDALPTAAEAEVVFEVADASLAYDRREKLAMYARAGIRRYVIVNIPDHCVELYEEPSPSGSYALTTVRRAGETIVLVGAGPLELAVERILP